MEASVGNRKKREKREKWEMENILGSFLLLWGIPLLINYHLAQKEAKNQILVMVLTIPLSWMVTSFLACSILIESPAFAETEPGECESFDNKEKVTKDGFGLICSSMTQIVEVYAPQRGSAKICQGCRRRNRKTDKNCFVCGAEL